MFHSSVRRPVVVLLRLLFSLLFTVNGLNVVASYDGRDFMTAFAERRAAWLFALAWLYAGVFAVTAVAAFFYRLAKERLGLLWRGRLTGDCIRRYLSGRAYYRFETDGRPDNPDPRISEDLRTFTATTLSLLLIFLNSAIALGALSGVLW